MRIMFLEVRIQVQRDRSLKVANEAEINNVVYRKCYDKVHSTVLGFPCGGRVGRILSQHGAHITCEELRHLRWSTQHVSSTSGVGCRKPGYKDKPRTWTSTTTDEEI